VINNINQNKNLGDLSYEYCFNPELRTLNKNGTENIRLRKKENEVLTLLCEKTPAPVSVEEFLQKVWPGCYVTSQSLAQIIRSLRIKLSDENKTLIVNIPKFGYAITEPVSVEEKNIYLKKVEYTLQQEEFNDTENTLRGFTFSNTVKKAFGFIRKLAS